MAPPVIARKSVTVIQEGSRYKESYLLPWTPPVGSTTRQVFFDSAGGTTAEIVGTVDGRRANFESPYADVEEVRNGSGFYCYVKEAGQEEEDMVRYGTVFRRELVFPNSPSQRPDTIVRSFEDNFQRRSGPVGGKWAVLVGRPRIFSPSNPDLPSTVGVDTNLFSRYFIRYFQPFNDDSVELSISATKKGTGKAIVALCCNTPGSSYLYIGFNGVSNTCEMGYGVSPDLGTQNSPSGALTPMVPAIPLTVPGSNALITLKIRYDDVTRRLSLFDSSMSEIMHWVDDDALVPHGRGYQYFGIGGNSSLFNSGVQLAYIKAHGIV